MWISIRVKYFCLVPIGFLILILGACSTSRGSDMVTALDLNLRIIEIDSRFEYELKLSSVVYEGEAELEWDGDLSRETVSLMKLHGIPWIVNPGDNVNPTAELINSESGFVLQNTGNSMNSFQILPADYKYIFFQHQI